MNDQISADEFRVVIPSRKRAEKCRTAVCLWPEVTVFVAEEEEADYRRALDDLDHVELVLHDGKIRGIGHLRHRILHTFDEDAIVMCDDDVTDLAVLVGRRTRRITDPGSVFQVAWNATTICYDLGLHVWSLNITQDIRKYPPTDPFGQNRVEASVCGIVGRELDFDPGVVGHDDLDISLQACLTDRILWFDGRFAPSHEYMSTGGASHVRDVDSKRRDIALMRKKWGQYFGVTQKKSTVSTAVRVKRRRSISV